MPFEPQDILPPPADANVNAAHGEAGEVAAAAADAGGANLTPPSFEVLLLLIVILVFFHRETGRSDGLGARLGEAGNGVVVMLAICVGILVVKFGRGFVFFGNGNGANGVV